MKQFALLLLLVFVACTSPNSSIQQKNYLPPVPELGSDKMTPEVLWSFGRVGSPQVSPDGATVLYTVTYYNIDENKAYRDIYTVPVLGGTSTNLTESATNEINAVWRPDGQKIGYLSASSGSVQLWEMDPNGSGKQKISSVEGGITGFNYSPDGKKIFYIRNVKLDENVQDLYPDLPKANARLEDDIMYRHWDTWHDYTYSHIFIAESNKPESAKDIMDGEHYDAPMKPFGGIEQVAWSPDGMSLSYTSKKKTGKEYAVSTNSDIYLYNTGTGKTVNLTEGMMGYDQNPLFSPNGEYLAWESMERDGYEADKNRLYIMNLKTGEKRDFTEGFDQNVSQLKWDAEGRNIYFISNIHGTDEIYCLAVSDGSIRRLTDGIHNYQTVEPAGGMLVAQKVSMSQPAELYLVDPETGADKQLTTVTKGIMDQLSMGKVEERWLETTDGKQMHTWIIYPPDFDPAKKYPALLYCQGGPQGTVSQFWSYRWNFQMMAANGYIVVAPNRRGLPGFGQEWNEQISRDYGGQNIRDLLTAIDEVSKEPYVDKDNLGAVGASYGGFSVFFLAGNHEGRFSAFIAHDGMFNFEHMYLMTEEMWFVNWEMGGPFWDKENAAAQRSYSFSPHRYVQNWDTPILVIHGEKDYRVTPDQGLAAFNAAKLMGIPARLLYFPEENHWVLQPQNGILWQRVFFNWLDKWLKD
jgi:dipeptidyl aminopeptidase/acylaminoacyl peptidase